VRPGWVSSRGQGQPLSFATPMLPRIPPGLTRCRATSAKVEILYLFSPLRAKVVLPAVLLAATAANAVALSCYYVDSVHLISPCSSEIRSLFAFFFCNKEVVVHAVLGWCHYVVIVMLPSNL